MIMLDGPQGDGTPQTPTPASADTGSKDENPTAAVKKSAPKKEEEISVEDLPF